MTFNTQVCTTREQSERLLALGVKKETADCFVWGCDGKDRISLYSPDSGMDEREGDTPTWSLHRLIAMCPNCIIDRQPCLHKTILDKSIHYCEENWKEEYEVFFNKPLNLFDNLVDCIEWLIKEGYFNKQYLNENL